LNRKAELNAQLVNFQRSNEPFLRHHAPAPARQKPTLACARLKANPSGLDPAAAEKLVADLKAKGKES